MHGRDKNYRPIVHYRPMVATRMGVSDPHIIARTVCWAAFYLDNNMKKDGVVENYVNIFDLEKASPW